MQADGNRDLERKRNRGDAGDPYPGTSGNTSFTTNSNPNSKSYTSQDTCVSISNISPSGSTMTARVTVICAKSAVKDAKDNKELIKEKDIRKEQIKEKDIRKEVLKEKEIRKEIRKEFKEFKEGGKDFKDVGEKGFREVDNSPAVTGSTNSINSIAETIADLQMRMALLEELAGIGNTGEPFIGEDLRPDLIGGSTYGSDLGDLPGRMSAGDRDAKIQFDNLPPR